MKHPRVLIVLLFAVTLLSMAIFDRPVGSQGQEPNILTNQADKVSGTGFAVTSCGEGQEIDCEPNDITVGASPTFTFSADADARPPAADPRPSPCRPGFCQDSTPAEEAP